MTTNNATNTGNPITVGQGGTGVATNTTAYGLLVAGTTATGAIQNGGTGSAGQVYVSGGSAALGTWIDVPSATWIDQTTGSATLTAGAGYVIDNGVSLVTLTLPATAALGDTYKVRGFSSGGWLVAQGSGQLIHFGNKVTTTGASGSLASTNAFDAIEITCVVTNTTFVVGNAVGNITVV